MTREEIIKLARALCTDFKCESDTMVDFCNSIIRELKQEPCDDIKQKIFNAIDNVPITLSRKDADNLLKMDIQNIIDKYKEEQ